MQKRMNKKLYMVVLFIVYGLWIVPCNITAGVNKDKDSTLHVDEIISKSEKIMRGDTSVGSMEMIVKTKRWTRSIKMKSWAEGKEKSFIKILYPSRDKGITFLRLDKEMWQYVPKIERTIKIPPSMMLQSWMGSDFTNDDLVKESSLIDDYEAGLLAEEEGAYKIELIPKPEAAVTWGKVLYWIDKTNFLQLREEFYDEDNLLINVLTFSEVKKFNDRYYPAKMLMAPQDEEKKGSSTTLHIESMVFNEPVEEGIFSLRSLKSMSR